MRVVGGGNIGRVDSRDSSMVVAVAVGGGRVAVGQESGISLSLSRPLAEVVDVVECMRVVGGGNIGRVDSRDSSMVVAVAVGGGRVAVGQVSGISLSLSISRPLVEVTTVEAIVGVVGGEVVGTPVAVGRVAVGQVGGVSLSLSLGGSKSSSNASDEKDRLHLVDWFESVPLPM